MYCVIGDYHQRVHHHGKQAKLLKGLQYVPRVIVTDELRSYGAAKRKILSAATRLADVAVEVGAPCPAIPPAAAGSITSFSFVATS